MAKVSLIQAAAKFISRKKIGDEFSTDEIREYIKANSDTNAKDGSIRRGVSHFVTGNVLENPRKGVYKVALSGTAEELATLASNSQRYRSRLIAKDIVEEAIMKRDKGCIYCGDLMDLVDHVNTRKAGTIGLTNLEDGAACCKRCNNEKEHISVKEFIIKQLTEKIISFDRTGNLELQALARDLEKCVKFLNR